MQRDPGGRRQGGQGGQGGRRDRLIQGHEHDPYRAPKKPSEPTVCPECGATFRGGRWTWARGPVDAPRQLCPACQRVRDGYPGGYLTLEGAFLVAHQQEIVGLARNVEEREKKEHPLKRIIELEVREDRIEITTTDMHLARAIGEGVQHAYGGDLDLRYSEDEMLLRAHWGR
ncbi:MAG: BCAM0308 family protein [Myxococcota bacterium]